MNPQALVRFPDGTMLQANPNVTVEQAQALVLALQPFFPGASILLQDNGKQLRISALERLSP